MNIKSLPCRAVRLSFVAFIVATLLLLSLPVAPLAALDAYEYFTIDYDIVFSSIDIAEGQSFAVTVTGQAECIQDLPLEPTEAIITGRIVAQHQGNDTTVILNPQYTVTISPFPYCVGDRSQSTQQLSLAFPAGSPPGEYNISGELMQAKLRAGLLFDVTEYLPSNEPMGSVNYDMPPVEPPLFTPPETPDEPEEPSGTPEQPDVPESPPENPQTPEDPPDNSITPASFTISDLAAPPAEVSQGDTIILSARISNTGGQPGQYEAALTLNGTVVETKQLTLESNTSQTVSFSLQGLEPGQYSFSINGLSDYFAIEGTATPPPEAPQQEEPDTGVTDEGGFPASTIIYVADALLAGIVIWLVLKRRRTA